MPEKIVLKGTLLGNLNEDGELSKGYGHLGPGIWDDDSCPGFVRHIAIMPDGRVFDLGKADCAIAHSGTAADFDQFMIVIKAA